jgi:hypothetical protein
MENFTTLLAFIEMSRIRGNAIEIDRRRGYPTRRSHRRRFPILRALTTPILRRRRSDDVLSTTLP